MRNFFSNRANRAPAHAPSSSRDDAQSNRAAPGSGSSASAQHSPRTVVMAQVRRNWLNANAVAMQQFSLDDQPDVRSLARQEVLGNVSKFHQAQLFGKTNAACLGDDIGGRLQDFGQLSVLQRKVSFLSIAPQLRDLDALIDGASGQPPRRIDAQTQTVLEEALKTIQLNHRIVETDAMSAARQGTRCLPLTVDSARFSNFLGQREALIAGVVDACRLSQGRAVHLKPLLHRLAIDYFTASGRLSGGLVPVARRGSRQPTGQVDPLRLKVGEDDVSMAEHLVDTQTGREQILLMIGTPVVAGPPEAYPHLLKGFENTDAAQQQAALVLQTLFYGMTSIEEKIVGSGRSARSEREHRQSRNTAREIDYVGSTYAGDGCNVLRDSNTQRESASAPLRRLPETLRAYQAAHQTPLLADADLNAWIADPGFQLDVLSMTYPALRLPNAQVSTTATLLANSRAFGGSGNAQR